MIVRPRESEGVAVAVGRAEIRYVLLEVEDLVVSRRPYRYRQRDLVPRSRRRAPCIGRKTGPVLYFDLDVELALLEILNRNMVVHLAGRCRERAAGDDEEDGGE
jgi:hypothetical protein